MPRRRQLLRCNGRQQFLGRQMNSEEGDLKNRVFGSETATVIYYHVPFATISEEEEGNFKKGGGGLLSFPAFLLRL